MDKMTEQDLTIIVEKTGALSEPTRGAVDHVCMTARLGEMTESLFHFLPPDGLHVMGYVDNRMVSHAVVTTRWVQPEGRPFLKCAYVDAVSTLPSAQGKGYGTRVMRHLTTVIPHYEIAALETARVSFYTHCGWKLWRGPLAVQDPDGKVTPAPHQSADRIMVFRLPITSGLNLDRQLTIRYDGRGW